MGIVNSFVNQIGREIGRDVYRNLTTKKVKRNDFESFEIKESTLDRIKNFEISEDGNNTIRELSNIVEQSENCNPEDFEWQNLFLEIDNKIDFCKENLDSQFKQKLEYLDSLNASNYENIKQKHINYIYQILDLLNQKKNELNSKNLIVAGLATFIGFRSFYINGEVVKSISRLVLLVLLGSIFYFGLKTCIDPINNAGNLPVKTIYDIEVIKNIGNSLMISSLVLYIFQLSIGFYKVYEVKKQRDENLESINIFQNYVDKIN